MSEVLDMETKKNTALSITVDDGRIAVPINNTNGEKVGTFYFNPTDIGIVERFKKASDEFDKVVEPITQLADDADDDAQIAALKEAEQRLYDLCNNLFGGNFAEAFFGSVNPFTPIDGQFYCENALNARLPSLYWSVLISSCWQPVNARRAATARAENLIILFITFFILDYIGTTRIWSIAMIG